MNLEKEMSPYINAVPCDKGIEETAYSLIRNRLTKEEHDRQERLKRDPRYKKTGKES